MSERSRVEEPAVALLEALGWRFVPADALERSSARSVVLTPVLERKLLEFNPWLSPENLAVAVRRVSAPESTGLVESNEEVHTVLTRGISVQQDLNDGLPSHVVRFVDFDDPSRNDFTVSRQVRLRRSSLEEDHDPKAVVFDLALFVNGVLWAVLECKDFVNGVQQALSDGLTQLERYQELRDGFRGDGAPRAFSGVQVTAVLCREAAVYGSVGAPARWFAPFPEAYPRSPEWLGTLMGLPSGQQPTAQDVLLYSVFSPENLLEFARSYTVFEVVERRRVRKLARHQQRIAVDRTARRVVGLDDPFDGRGPRAPRDAWRLEPMERGGVIWHTQGSGKSLTMVWLTLKLRQPGLGLGNPVIVVVTDRVDLDRQIAGVFRGAGLIAPERARTVQELKRLLGATAGATIMTTVQKFQDAVSRAVLNASGNVIALVDEAHRTQYGYLASSMRSALPNATFIAFTGTPIDKRDRSTIQTFGPYIHRYTMLEAVRDGATVPIYYEGRDLETFGVAGSSVDEVFERWFADYSPEDRERIKARFATQEAVAGAPARVRAIALDIAKHFEAFIAPNGFKGQVVVASREIAVRYKEALDEFGASPSKVVFTVSNNDEARFKQFDRSKTELDELLERFKKDPDDPVKLLIVVDMLLTGFDAPLEQVMYLDKPLREHALLQAIARVNRTAPGKDRGFIVDYWGVTDDLREALQIFDAADVQEVMRPVSDILKELEGRHRAAMRVFGGKRISLDRALGILEDETQRQDFEVWYARTAQSLNALLPSQAAAPFVDDFKWLSRVRLEARSRIDRTVTADYSGIAPKVRRLIDESIQADGVQQILAPVDILSSQFDERVRALGSLEAQASEMAHAARREITVKFPQNPVFYASLRERLEQIIRLHREGRLDAAAQVQALRELVERIRNAPANRAQQLGLSPDAEAIYNLLEEANKPDKALARTIEDTLKNLVVVDWLHKDDVQREMRRQLRRELRAAGLEKNALEPVVNRMLDVARSRLAR